ncbi:hypothetical protein [Rhodospirillaceae bacterium SYSU D60014]|jgi:hypothetical protein|uniref:hypothetical protein n=1 Tax=Virgifigura deserti TaxID=2268457 RepID=UPI000E6740AD
MTDLREADFSGRPDEDMTPEERQELQRRFTAFTTALKEQDLRRQAGPPAPKPKKTISKWDPLTAGKRAK